MGLIDLLELVGAVIATLAAILAAYAGWSIYQREKKFAPPKRRRRSRPVGAEPSKSKQRPS